MPRTLTFDIVYRYPENAKGITIPVTLISPKGTYRAAAKADTGADVCLFSNDAGLQLGLDVESGIPKTLVTPGGTEIESFGNEVTIQTLGITLTSVIYSQNTLGLLGTSSVESGGFGIFGFVLWTMIVRFSSRNIIPETLNCPYLFFHFQSSIRPS